MTETEREGLCRHDECGCLADPHGFCGAYCANAAASDDDLPSACACGHARCEEAQRPPRREPEAPVSVGPAGGRTGRKRRS